jgi:hypothetical protein
MIEDATPRPLRAPHEPEQIRHANGALGVAGITVLARNGEKSAKAYEGILRTRAQTLKSPRDDQRPGSILSLGATWILLTEPGSLEEAEHLALHGEGPYRITLRRRNGPISPGMGSLLDPALLSGAQIALA